MDMIMKQTQMNERIDDDCVSHVVAVCRGLVTIGTFERYRYPATHKLPAKVK